MINRYVWTACLLLCSQALWAQTTGQLTPEKLWKLGRVGLEAVSPDGSQVVLGIARYQLADNKGNRDLYLMPLAGDTPRKITAFAGNERNARWRPDGQKIAFLSSESGSAQVWEMNPDGSDKQQVSDIVGGIDGFAYAPTGDKLLFIKTVQMDPTTADRHPDLPRASARVIDDLMYRHWDSWEDGAYSHVFYLPYADGKAQGAVVDIMAGQPYDAPMNPFGGMEQIAWSPDGNFIAYTCKKLRGKAYATSTDSDIYLYDLQSGQTSNLSEGLEGYDMEPVFSPDGRYLVWNSMATPGYEADRQRIMLLDRQTGARSELTQGIDQDANHPRWSADGRYLYFQSGIRATKQLCEIEVATRAYRQLTSGNYDYGSFAVAGTSLVAERMSISEPTELFRIDLRKGEVAPLTQVNREPLAGIRMGRVEERLIRTSDGQQMLTWVIYPPDFEAGKKYPALLYCQGGPQSTVSQFFSYRWNFQLMAAQGYIVVAPNRRGLPSFGQTWNDQIADDWGGQAMRDLLSAIDSVAKEPAVDASRLGAVGASFGGYSVYWLAGNHEKRFKALISHCGPYNFESWYATTEELFFANHDIGGPYWERKPHPSYKLHSPHLYVGNWDTPILVIHGGNDFRVPISEGMQAFHAAQIQGIPSRFLYFPDEGHWVVQPQNALLWHREFFTWLDAWLKP